MAWGVPVFLATVIVTYMLIRIGYRNIPLERDEGAYLYMGRLLVEGGVPYVDFFEAKPPGIFYVYALLHILSGGNLAWMHVLMAIVVAVSTLFLYGLARSWIGNGPALVTVVVFSALSMSIQASGFTLQSEHFVVFFSLAGLYALDRALAMNRPWLALVAGVLFGCSLSIKQNGVFFMMFAMAYSFLAYPSPRKERWRYARMLVAGAVLPLMALLAIIFFQGALGQLWFWVVEVARYYVGTLTFDEALELLSLKSGLLFHENPLLWVLGGLGAMLFWAGPGQRWQRMTVGSFLVMSALTLVPGLRFFGHYFLMFFPALAICAGALVQLAVRWPLRNTHVSNGVKSARLLIAVCLFAGALIQDRHDYFDPDHEKVLRRAYHTNPFPEARMVADLINERIRPGDGVFVMGFEPQIHVYTGTRSPIRWVNTNALLLVHPLADSVRNEVRSVLASSPPRFVVWVQHYSSWMPPKNADQSFIGEYWDQLHREYDVIACYEQYPPYELHVMTGEAARNYSPKGELFLFLAERRETSTGATAQ
jgi:hypothetical protein